MSRYTVIVVVEATGRTLALNVIAQTGLQAFACAAANLAASGEDPSGYQMVVAIKGAVVEGDNVEYPGEGLVDGQTILEQADVFGTPCAQLEEGVAEGPSPEQVIAIAVKAGARAHKTGQLTVADNGISGAGAAFVQKFAQELLKANKGC